MTENQNVVQETTTTTRTLATPEPTKTFRAGPTVRNFVQNGRTVNPGETVELTANQAKNWRDKFTAVDESEFTVKDQKEVAKNAERAELKATAGEDGAPQGLPVPAPVNSVAPPPATPAAPADPNALDPDRQGQPSREQRNVIDGKTGPAPTAPALSPARGAATAGATPAGASNVPPATAGVAPANAPGVASSVATGPGAGAAGSPENPHRSASDAPSAKK